MDTYYLAILWAALALGLFSFFSWKSLKINPTHRLRESSLISALIIFPFSICLSIAPFVIDQPLSFIILLPMTIVYGIIGIAALNRYKALIEEELEKAKDIGETNGTELLEPGPRDTAFRFWYPVSLVVSFAVASPLLFRYRLLLLDPDEIAVGCYIAFLILSTLACFYLIILYEYLALIDKNRFGLISRDEESKRSLYDRILKCRNPGSAGDLLLLIPLIGSFMLFAYSSFCQDVIRRTEYRCNISESDFDLPESASVDLTGRPGRTVESDLAVLTRASYIYGPQNSNLAVSLPLGYGNDDQGRLLWSVPALELMKDRIRKRLADEQLKPLLEIAACEVDHLTVVLMYHSESREAAYRVLKETVFENDLGDDRRFDEIKNELLERLGNDRHGSERIAEFFAPAAAFHAREWKCREISCFQDLGGDLTLDRLKDYLAKRIETARPFVGEVITNENVRDSLVTAVELLGKRSENVREAALRRTGAVEPEQRISWDLNYRVVVDTWPLPDPANHPYEHVAAVYGIRLLQRTTSSLPAEAHGRFEGLVAVRMGCFSGPNGPTAYVSSVWRPESRPVDYYEELISLLKRNSDRKEINDDRILYAQYFAPARINGHTARNAPFAGAWATNRFRYAPYLEQESQYRLLHRDCLWLSSRAIVRAASTLFSDVDRVRTILEPKE